MGTHLSVDSVFRLMSKQPIQIRDMSSAFVTYLQKSIVYIRKLKKGSVGQWFSPLDSTGDMFVSYCAVVRTY